MITIDIDNIDELRIFPLLEELGYGFMSPEQLSSLEMKILTGLDKQPWTKDQQRKNSREYNYAGIPAVIIRFTYVLEGKKIKSFQKFIEWLKADGNVGISKDITPDDGVGKIIKLNKSIREDQIDYLREQGDILRETAELFPEPTKSQYIQVADSVDLLLLHYDAPITEYEKTGDSAFKDAIDNETDATILAILAIIVNTELQNVKDVIFEQIV